MKYCECDSFSCFEPVDISDEEYLQIVTQRKQFVVSPKCQFGVNPINTELVRTEAGYTVYARKEIFQKITPKTPEDWVKHWNSVMGEVLAGSEFYNNPRAYVKRFRELQDLVKRQAMRIRRLEAKIAIKDSDW